MSGIPPLSFRTCLEKRKREKERLKRDDGINKGRKVRGGASNLKNKKQYKVAKSPFLIRWPTF